MKTLTRRDFLGYGATLVMASSASWFGYRWLNRLPSISVNKVGLPLAHLLRDKQLIAQPVREHDCDILILGSGAAALSAAWYLTRNGQTNFLLAEGLERNGNNAAYRFSADLSAPSGAHYLPQPSVESDYIRMLLADLGILQGYDAQQNPIYSETDLVHAPDERLFYHGVWQDGLTSKQDSDTQRFFCIYCTNSCNRARWFEIICHACDKKFARYALFGYIFFCRLATKICISFT